MALSRGLHFDFGVEQACSAAARVTSSLLPRPLMPRGAACGSVFVRERIHKVHLKESVVSAGWEENESGGSGNLLDGDSWTTIAC